MASRTADLAPSSTTPPDERVGEQNYEAVLCSRHWEGHRLGTPHEAPDERGPVTLIDPTIRGAFLPTEPDIGRVEPVPTCAEGSYDESGAAVDTNGDCHGGAYPQVRITPSAEAFFCSLQPLLKPDAQFEQTLERVSNTLTSFETLVRNTVRGDHDVEQITERVVPNRGLKKRKPGRRVISFPVKGCTRVFTARRSGCWPRYRVREAVGASCLRLRYKP